MLMLLLPLLLLTHPDAAADRLHRLSLRTSTLPFHLLLFLLLLLLRHLPLPLHAADPTSATRFDFGTLTLSSLTLLGDAHLRNGSIHLSRDLPVPNSGAGRALYSRPVRFRHPDTRAPFSFSTYFSFSVTHLNPSSIGGGLAFLLASDDRSVGDPGGFLGLINASDAATGSGQIVLAVEFDTLMDVEFSDVNGNHVGVDLNSVVSTQVADLDAAGVDLKSGDLVNAWVEYDGPGKLFQVFVSYSTVRPPQPVLSFPIDLSRFVDDYMYVGFSGSTQGSTETHSIEWWSFASAGSSLPVGGGSAAAGAPPGSSTTDGQPPGSSSTMPFTPAAANSSSSSSPSGTTTIGATNPSSSGLPPSSTPTLAQGPTGTDTDHPKSSCQSNGLCRQGPAAVAGVATASAFCLVAFAGLLVWGINRKYSKAPLRLGGAPGAGGNTKLASSFSMLSGAGRRSSNSALLVAPDLVRTPREFSYKELSAATRGFDPSRIIGHGAFGTVYKGIVQETGALIAVKRCISTGGQGRAEFLSELSIIASLRHRNLVRLQGWCQQKGEILLVYDYMPNGSLDKALFGDNIINNNNRLVVRGALLGGPAETASITPQQPSPTPLTWRHRKRILTGVASALAYLHRECEHQVIHRDVKSSNIMLDHGFHARLGDFGLARQVEHDKSPDATVTAGTMGYLAPEYLLTGRATDKTDVFSFGAVVLEVACGRRPIDDTTTTTTTNNNHQHHHHIRDSTNTNAHHRTRACGSMSNLVEWVWGLHGDGRLLDAVDPRLGGEYDEGDIRRAMLVGLACSHPDHALRPGMRSVVQMLSGEADPPFVPPNRPSMSWSTTHHLIMSLQDSVSDWNGALTATLSSISSSSSVGGGGGGGGGPEEGDPSSSGIGTA